MFVAPLPGKKISEGFEIKDKLLLFPHPNGAAIGVTYEMNYRDGKADAEI
jgi:hypothetical protein